MKRYVCGANAEGRSDVLIEQDLEPMPELIPGLFNRELWLTHETPVALDEDPTTDPTTGPLRHDPPLGGSIFRLMKMAPASDKPLTAETVAELSDLMQSREQPEGVTAKDPSMHRTDSIDYLIVLSGEILILTEERDVLLKAGDVVVQKGAVHGWRNEGTEPCVIAGVLIGAKTP